MDVTGRIKELMKTRGWSEYRLAKESGLSQSTLANIFRRKSIPSIPTLEAICNGLGVSLAQFFAEDELVELSAEQKETFYKWNSLTSQQKTVVFDLINSYDASSKISD